MLKLLYQHFPKLIVPKIEVGIEIEQREGKDYYEKRRGCYEMRQVEEHANHYK